MASSNKPTTSQTKHHTNTQVVTQQTPPSLHPSNWAQAALARATVYEKPSRHLANSFSFLITSTHDPVYIRLRLFNPAALVGIA